MRTKRTTIPAALSALSAIAPAPAWAGQEEVIIEGFAYSPDEITIEPMTTVRWTNLDDIEHTVTSQTGPGTLVKSGLFDSGSLYLGDVFEFTFEKPGDYYYFCIPHGGAMQGVVHVVPAPAGAGTLIGLLYATLRRRRR